MKTIARLAAENAIAALRTVSIAGGYNTDPIVEEHKKGGNAPADSKWVVIVPEQKPRDGAPIGFKEVDQPLVVECFHLPLNADPQAVASRLSEMAGDVLRKLMEDANRGGYAIYTRIEKAEQNAEDAPYFVRVTAQLWVRHLLNDPYRQT